MSKEAMKLALEAMLDIHLEKRNPMQKEAITALQKALANEALDKMAENARELGLDYEVEPKIGCVNHDCDKCKALAEPTSADYAMGYAEGFNDACKPAQRTWVGLTESEITTSLPYSVTRDKGCFHAGALWAEAKLKEKNA